MDFQIENISEADVQGFLQFRRTLTRETDFMLPTSDELQGFDEQQAENLKKHFNADNLNFLIAKEAGEICGFILLNRETADKTKHRASLVMGILDKAKGSGLADQLISRSLDWAAEQLLHRLELSVISTNERAIRFYKRHRFQIEGERREAVTLNGRYVSELYMGRILDVGLDSN